MKQIASLTFVCLLLAGAMPVRAQQLPDRTTPATSYQQQAPSELFARGTLDGRTAAEDKSTGGWFAGGFVSGVSLGLVGTGVMYAITASSNPKVPADRLTAMQDRGPNYVTAYQESYREAVKRKRRRSALIGGLTGTATIVAIVLSTSSN